MGMFMDPARRLALALAVTASGLAFASNADASTALSKRPLVITPVPVAAPQASQPQKVQAPRARQQVLTAQKRKPSAEKSAQAERPSSPPPREQFTAAEQEIAAIPGMPDARFFGDSEKDFLKAVSGADGAWIALSGGGEEGAFGAGLMAGLTASGTRTDFTVVTGVSTGALMAPYVFLGPRYDAALRANYTGINSGDIFELAQTPESFFDTWPLKKLIEKQITPELLAEIAAEHRKGRRLFIVSTSLDSGRPVVWNIGAIASRGGDKSLKLVRDVLLASSSIPGFFPPVHIQVEADGKTFTEMHADGTIRAPFYIAPESLLAGLGGAHLPASQLYVVVNSRLGAGFEVTNRSTLSVLGRAITVALKATMRGEILRAYTAAQRHGVGFQLAVVPSDFNQQGNGVFDTDYMKALYEAGLKQGMSGEAFRSIPPGVPETSSAMRTTGASPR
jgi:predicted acylesterase/phospholipase RssA